jgi:hypothetical protein
LPAVGKGSYFQSNALPEQRKHGDFIWGPYTYLYKKHISGGNIPEYAQIKFIAQEGKVVDTVLDRNTWGMHSLGHKDGRQEPL